MTKKEIRATLGQARDTAWERVLRYERESGAEAWPEQRSGRLEMKDVRRAELRGVIQGLDAARRKLGVL